CATCWKTASRASRPGPWSSVAPCGRGARHWEASCSTPAASSPDRKSTRLNSSHGSISYAVFCLKKKNNMNKADHWRIASFQTLKKVTSETLETFEHTAAIEALSKYTRHPQRTD